MEQQPIIVIGGSAGSITSLMELIAQLPEDFEAAICIVVHLNRSARSNLTTLLQRRSALPVAFAEDQQAIEPGQVYVAPPDYHLFLKPGNMRLIRGPAENRMRPAIDVLFRSAAVAYRNYVTGVILSGLLDDGSLGLQVIKRCGGTAIVQDPEEAMFPDMPESAIALAQVDQVLPVEAMGAALLESARHPPQARSEVPKDILLESQMIERVMFKSAGMAEIGNTVAQGCPTCNGPLWQMKFPADNLRYRCHVGHSFTARSLIDAQDDAAEEALWVALRTLEERGRLLERISEDSQQKGARELAKKYRARAEETLNHAEKIRRLLFSLGPQDTQAETTQEY